MIVPQAHHHREPRVAARQAADDGGGLSVLIIEEPVERRVHALMAKHRVVELQIPLLIYVGRG